MNKDGDWGEISAQIDKILKLDKIDRRKTLKENCGNNAKLYTDCSNYLSFIEIAENIDFLEREVELHSKLFLKLKHLKGDCKE